MKKHHSFVVFQDKMTISLCILLLLLLSGGSVWLLYLTTLPTSSSLSSIWAARIIFTLTGLALPILLVINPDRYFVWYRFLPEELEYHTLFRRKRIIPYSTFPYIMHGKYYHGIYWRDYILFSDRRLNDTELNHINHVAPSVALVKVRYTKKTSDTLLDVLPSRYKPTILSIRKQISIRSQSEDTF